MTRDVIIDAPVREVLQRAGWQYVGRKRAQKIARLNKLLNENLHVDKRRKGLTSALEEARRIASEL